MKLFFPVPIRLGIMFILVCFFLSACHSEPAQNSIIKTEYPKLAEAVAQRDFNQLWQFTEHKNEYVRALALKAIAASETDDLTAFLDYSIQQDDSLAWYALSLHPLNNEQIEIVNQHFSDGSIQSEAVCEVLFRKGNSTSLNFLLDKEPLVLTNRMCAQAVGGILSRERVDDLTRRRVFDLAFNADDETIWRNLLYGFYRSPLNRPQPESVLTENLSTMMNARGDSFTIMMDRYMVRIAGKAGAKNVMDRRSDRELNQAIQLSNELARNVILFEENELNHPSINRLLNHNTHNVVAQTLASLQEFEKIDKELLDMIRTDIVPETRNAEVFVEALNLLHKNGIDLKIYEEKLHFMDDQNEYLKHRILPLFKVIESDDVYVNRIKNEIREGGIGGLRAVQALTNYYSENVQNPVTMESVKTLVQFSLIEGDRSVISSLNTLLMSPNLFTDVDYQWMYNQYEEFTEHAEWEKAEVLDEVLKNRFPDRFEGGEKKEREFRIPDWNRLYELGTQPVWVLETDKGTIEIQLDPLAAPFTVSSIDSLTRAGAYDNIPFHRVVRNFVIQGGDIDRKDGFGGPDYKLPTEPSFQSFERNMVGIASSGPDTEGSQFFVMLEWSPHLDGYYTIFGKVISGMNVADRIQVGDMVLKAEIYTR